MLTRSNDLFSISLVNLPTKIRLLPSLHETIFKVPAAFLLLLSALAPTAAGQDAASRITTESHERLHYSFLESFESAAAFFGCNASLTGSGRAVIRLMNAAIVHSFWSESHLPLANIPARRMPCFATQKT